MARLKIKHPPDHSIGVKDFKDQVSGLIDHIERTGQSIVITKNNRKVARLVPIQENDSVTVLRDLGLIASEPQQSWRGIRLERLGLDATVALAVVTSDREGGN